MRTDNVIKNSYFALLGQAVTVILKAITQIVFVRMLSVEYLGLNGLFANILTMLSLAELGVGSAILYNMYKPMAQNDQKRIKALMNFYKETYRKIGLFMLIVGFLLLPFLGYIIKEQPDIPELKLIYILYVINNAVSYFFIFKQSILIADQKKYVITKSDIVKNLIMNILQIVFLIITRSFLLYLCISILMTILFNIINSKIADKKYPYLIDNHEYLEKSEKKAIYKDVYAMMAHKLGGVIVTGTDNLLLSAFVGITAVGLYSNYVLILSSVKGFLNQVYEALVSSIGDLINTESTERIYEVYKKMLFISFWITTIISIGFGCLSSYFVEIAFGKEYILSYEVVAIMALNFYVTDLTGIRAVTNKFKTAEGLFWNDRYKPYFESAINLIASIVLLKLFGFVGILLGTLISTITTGFWIEPLVLYKHAFNRKLREYFKIYIKKFTVFLLSWLVSYSMISFLECSVISLIIGALICILIPSVIICIIYGRSMEYKYVGQLLLKIVRRI